MSAMGWARGAQCTQVQGITCDGDGMVTALDVSQRDLNGSLPIALSALSRLQSLDVNGNHLSGTLPSALSTLVRLRTLTLTGNNFTGPIFNVVVNMPSLVTL
ncbi:unnamed protein product, partial [Closterium sp. Yama58-4]